ncbi:hypothetical protein F1640_18490 [Novosphingobium sp. NBM11]|uniref:hypothetical protein n=1 Tax=Novosphingobium sp. NBM11 TaxID=2596914 RepID=UPI0018926AE8|nr:hypothetical protein [Novosphingobium sp. NBM11]MBF5091945.1 hypothetical protein [Novosphingobium sp. NBM11]
MSVTHYKSSKGAVVIADMPLRYATNALNKLRRDEPERADEIEALAAHVDRLGAEEAAKAEQAEPDQPSMIGHNGGPQVEEPDAPAAKPPLTPWEAIKINFDDLLVEAGNWADGVEITTQDQADTVGRLRGMLQDACSAADNARTAEKKPLDDKVAEIQARYNEYIAPIKNRQPGKATKAIAALGNLLAAYLKKQDDERRERERAAAKAAAEAAAKALAAREEAKTTSDIAVMEDADVLLADAAALLKQAKSVSREKVQAGGGEGLRAQTLRTSYVVEPSGKEGAWNDALRHYMRTRPEAIRDLLLDLARSDVRNPGLRAQGIPGFIIREVKGV